MPGLKSQAMPASLEETVTLQGTKKALFGQKLDLSAIRPSSSLEKPQFTSFIEKPTLISPGKGSKPSRVFSAPANEPEEVQPTFQATAAPVPRSRARPLTLEEVLSRIPENRMNQDERALIRVGASDPEVVTLPVRLTNLLREYGYRGRLKRILKIPPSG